MSVRSLALSVGTCLGSGGVERAQDHDIRESLRGESFVVRYGQCRYWWIFISVISGAANFVRSMNYAFRVSLRLRSLSELSMMPRPRP